MSTEWAAGRNGRPSHPRLRPISGQVPHLAWPVVALRLYSRLCFISSIIACRSNGGPYLRMASRAFEQELSKASIRQTAADVSAGAARSQCSDKALVVHESISILQGAI